MAANPNTLTAGIQDTWDKVYQVTHHKLPVYPAFTNFRLAAGLKKGDVVNRQYRNTLVAYPMAGDGGYQRQAITDTNETLTINQVPESSFYIKELDEIQNHLPTRAKHAYDAAVAVFNRVDGDVLGEYDQFTNNLDDGDLGGTAGNGISVTVSNIRQLFSGSTKLLQRNNIRIDTNARFTGFRKEDSSENRPVAILSPDVYQILLESLDGKDSALGDKVGINGHQGTYFGYDIFVSNAIGWSGRLVVSTIYVADDTVTVNGVVMTFKASVGSTAGNLLLGANAAANIDAVVAAINDSESLAAFNGGAGASTAGTLYVEFTLANRNLLLHMTATDNTSSMDLKVEGRGFITVSTSSTPTDNSWTAALQVQHCLIGVNNTVDLVLQKTPDMLIKDRDGKVGKDVVTWAAYGLKTFNESLLKMIDVRARTDAY